jgi:hypothetical protein
MLQIAYELTKKRPAFIAGRFDDHLYLIFSICTAQALYSAVCVIGS